MVVKDPSSVDVRFAFCFPDVYEIGMSYLGYQILYNVLNKISYVQCERVYSPWHDFESLLKKEDIPLFSLETKMPLAEFDIIGFTLQYEMHYTNILNMLDFKNTAHFHCSHFYTDGRCFYKMDIDKDNVGKGIQAIKLLSPFDVVGRC